MKTAREYKADNAVLRTQLADQRETEKKLRAQLAERDALLREAESLLKAIHNDAPDVSGEWLYAEEGEDGWIESRDVWLASLEADSDE